MARGINEGGWHQGDVWEDTGCPASPTCLKCPLPQCKYDSDEAYRVYREYVKAIEDAKPQPEPQPVKSGQVPETNFHLRV